MSTAIDIDLLDLLVRYLPVGSALIDAMDLESIEALAQTSKRSKAILRTYFLRNIKNRPVSPMLLIQSDLGFIWSCTSLEGMIDIPYIIWSCIAYDKPRHSMIRAYAEHLASQPTKQVTQSLHFALRVPICGRVIQAYERLVPYAKFQETDIIELMQEHPPPSADYMRVLQKHFPAAVDSPGFAYMCATRCHWDLFKAVDPIFRATGALDPIHKELWMVTCSKNAQAGRGVVKRQVWRDLYSVVAGIPANPATMLVLPKTCREVFRTYEGDKNLHNWTVFLREWIGDAFIRDFIIDALGFEDPRLLSMALKWLQQRYLDHQQSEPVYICTSQVYSSSYHCIELIEDFRSNRIGRQCLALTRV